MRILCSFPPQLYHRQSSKEAGQSPDGELRHRTPSISSGAGTCYQKGAPQTIAAEAALMARGRRNCAGQRPVWGKPGRAEKPIFPFRADTEAVQRRSQDTEVYHSVIAASADFSRAV